MNRLGLRGRLLIAQLLVLLVGAATLTVVATLVAAPLFHYHLAHAGVEDAQVRLHTEEAFAQAGAVALAAGAAVALGAAAITSVILMRRITAPVSRLVEATGHVARGRYDVPITRSGDADFARLENAFADMAGRLYTTELSRRRLLDDLAHELRTPVATLEAYLEGIEDDVLPADATSWQVMHDQLDRLRRLVSDLSDLSAADEHALDLHPEEGDLAATVAASVSAAGPRFADKQVGLEAEPPEVLPPVRFDSQRVAQILTNLLENALRHTPAGGRVVVTCERTDRATVLVRVRDTGDGIPADQLDAVFERFHRVDPARSPGGSGLGLTIARSLARAHGGDLTAASDGPGRGARFDLTLPTNGCQAETTASRTL